MLMCTGPINRQLSSRTKGNTCSHPPMRSQGCTFPVVDDNRLDFRSYLYVLSNTNAMQRSSPRLAHRKGH